MKRPPVVSFVGPSGSGKTTLLRALVRILVRRGYRVGVIKHSSGFADPDKRGKDSWLLRKAGAKTLLLASRDRSILFLDHPRKEPSVSERLGYFDGYDLVLVESWKQARFPLIAVRRGEQKASVLALLIERKYLKKK